MGDQLNQNISLYRPVLDIDAINDLDDCKKILMFLSAMVLQPIPEGVDYAWFHEVEKYFIRSGGKQ